MPPSQCLHGREPAQQLLHQIGLHVAVEQQLFRLFGPIISYNETIALSRSVCMLR